eukprot:449545_1
MFEENVDGISDIQQFINGKRSDFAKIIKKHTKMSLGIGGKLYTKIIKTLRQTAQTLEFGKFLSDYDINAVDKDYYHILRIHINSGDKNIIKNTFRFFQSVVHMEDLETDIIACRSVKRRTDRMNEIKSTTQNDYNSAERSKNMYELKQYYIQTQLDMIHTYLVHSNWKQIVKRYAIVQYDEKQDEYDFVEDDQKLNEDIQNKNKYTTELSESANDNYGFGIEHSHEHLAPIFASIHDEFLFNTLCVLTDEEFEMLLIKGIRLRVMALGEHFGDTFLCKYYKEQYNIIRNEPIGIKHIIAIITYTDKTEFC